MKVLFISRAHLPVLGGLESQNDALRRHLSKKVAVQSIVNRHGKKALPWFLPWAVFRASMLARQADVVLLGDGVASTVGWILKKTLCDKPVCCVLHGLDVTYSRYGYQKFVVKTCLESLDHFIAVSNGTKQKAVECGLDPDKISVIPNGIEPPGDCPDRSRPPEKDAAPLELITVGRLVRRKGVAWFISNVLPKLDQDVIYTVIGDGPERENIEAATRKSPGAGRIHLLGRVADDTKWELLQSADLFVQPNIVIPNDPEGFGIAVLEAGIQGTPVVASKIEGLLDSVQEGQNGWLVSPSDANAFAKRINQLSIERERIADMGDRAREFVYSRFNWPLIAEKYADILCTLTDKEW